MDSELLHRFSTTVQSIHAAALQPEGWPEALAHIAALHNAPKALAFTPLTHPGDGGFVLAHAIAHQEETELDLEQRYSESVALLREQAAARRL